MNLPKLTRKDFQTDQDVRWCPGCGDYAILAALQKVLPELGVAKEQIAVVSGIGCSSRLPYYVDTFGFHTIHGRAFAVATGLKAAQPDLSVWVVTGDGDALSIGGNHLIHTLRRNVDVNILLFNNRIYGLTKGQYSPTSELGKRTSSTPFGSIDRPFEPLQLALGAQATFVARTIDREAKHMTEVFHRAAAHRGTSFVEIYQNCNIFNDGAYAPLTDRETKQDTQLHLTHGEPLVWGADGEHCIVRDGFALRVARTAEVAPDAIVVHDEAGSPGYHHALAELTLDADAPVPFGVLRAVEAPTYEARFTEQIDAAASSAHPSLQEILVGKHSWEIGARGAVG
jgi:2-oxoglutarate/2-oxoacid ferredoxin oxidoreductase subunit beta